MTAKSEIENRNLYYKRRSSCRNDFDKKRAATFDDSDENVCVVNEQEFIRTNPKRRIKSTSVCVGTLQLQGERRLPLPPPRTLNDFQFLNPEMLTMQSYEIQTLRPPALSTTEVFNEIPPLYIYRAVPVQKRKPVSNVSKSQTWITKIRNKKHTICAWSFGIFAVLLCLIVVILQSRSDFK